MTDHEPTRLLVVCTANVCRSPLAAEVLRRALGSGDLGRIEIASAGTRAQQGWAMCGVSAAELAPADRDAAAAHASRPATPGLVQRSDLVLTMERQQRSAIARLAPGSQSRVFTLREALGLLEVLQRRGTRVPPDARSLASALHAARGLAAPPPPPPQRRWWQRAAEPEDHLTIVDGHGLDDEQHRAATAQVRATAEAVAAGIRSVTAAR